MNPPPRLLPWHSIVSCGPTTAGENMYMCIYMYYDTIIIRVNFICKFFCARKVSCSNISNTRHIFAIEVSTNKLF